MKDEVRFCLFDTALGACAIAWGAQGVVGSQLPEESAGATRERMRLRFPAAREAEPTFEMADVIAAIQRLLAGQAGDAAELLAVRLDERGIPEFNRRVHALTRAIPLGQTLTYGELAQRLGEPGAARAVGQAEGHNPFAPIVPCHRVIASVAGQGGFSAHGGLATKQRLLAIEARAVGQLAGEQGSLFG